tara:strand:+ start:25 stop:399 length:375 start_codon:yes stop_codon:yes gene_type:complete
MRNILTGIQQALEAIRIETEKADWQLRLEILQLMLSASASVVAGARKQAAPQVKQVKQTVPVPRTKYIFLNSALYDSSIDIVHKSYPVGSALFYFIFLKYSTFSESVLYFAQSLLLLLPLACFI